MSEPTKPDDDATRWRKPEDEQPKPRELVEAWIDDKPWGIWCSRHAYISGGVWYEGNSMPSFRATVLAWRPIQPPDVPPWLADMKVNR